MIRAVIQGRVGKTLRTAEMERPNPADRFRAAVLLLTAAIYVMAGWSAGADNILILIAALLAMHNIWVAARRVEDGNQLSFGAYVAVFVASCAGFAVLAWLIYDAGADISALAGVIGGHWVTAIVDDSRRRILPPESPAHTLHWIAQPMLFKRPGTDLPERFEPQFPFKSQSDEGVWAIDPDRRAVRIMLPSEDDLDIVLPWDEPIRAVTLRRYRRRFLPIGGGIGAMLRGDRELVVTSGAADASAWTHIFHFAGDDKELALHWRDAFESWMRQDRRAAGATVSVR